MKTIPLLLALCLTAAIGQKLSIQREKQVLSDFRIENVSKPVRIPAATQRFVLSKLFRKYLTNENRCGSDFAGDLQGARNAGQIVPLIADMTTGSFTAAGQTQTAYVIFVSECNASHAENFGTKRMAIFSGQQLVANVDIDFKMNIIRKTDLNSDGIDELLMTAGDMNQGTVIEVASLLSFQNGRMQVIQEFSTVKEDSCASGAPGSRIKAAVISISDVVPGQMPKLRMENYQASCRGPKRWRFISTGMMQ